MGIVFSYWPHSYQILCVFCICIFQLTVNPEPLYSCEQIYIYSLGPVVCIFLVGSYKSIYLSGAIYYGLHYLFDVFPPGVFPSGPKGG